MTTLDSEEWSAILLILSVDARCSAALLPINWGTSIETPKANSATLLAATSLAVMALKASNRIAMITSSMPPEGGNELASSETMVTEGNLATSIALANNLLREHSIDLQFDLQCHSNQVIVRLRDSGSDQILKEYSSQAMLTILAGMSVTIGRLLHDAA